MDSIVTLQDNEETDATAHASLAWSAHLQIADLNVFSTQTVLQIKHAGLRNVLIPVQDYVGKMPTVGLGTMYPYVFAMKGMWVTHFHAVINLQVSFQN